MIECSGGNISAILDSRGNTSPTVLWMFHTSAAVYSTPAISVSTVFIGCDDSYLYALNATNGTLLWKFKTSSSIWQASPALYRNMVFIGSSDNTLYALSVDTGEVLWTHSSNGNLGHSSPVIGGDGSIYLTTYSSAYVSVGSLISLHSQTGALHWSKNLDGDASGPAIGADGKKIMPR